MRVARGAVGEVGSNAIWYRVDRSIIGDEPISPLMRAAITAGFCNGTGAILDPQQWTFNMRTRRPRMSSEEILRR